MFFSWARMRFHRLRSFPTSWMTQWGHLGRRIRCRSRYAGIALTILYARFTLYYTRASRCHLLQLRKRPRLYCYPGDT
jgi:hypothetical protein